MDSATYLNHLPEADQSLPKHGLTLPKVYRSYKNSPHNPDALKLKYLVHRLENGHKYNSATPELQNQMDADFLKHHQQGKASEKNGHIQVQDLQDFIRNPSTKALAKNVVNHKIKLNNLILKEQPEHIVNINGQPHIRLTRGLYVDKNKRGVDHALASYADIPDPPFGSFKHHQLVPLSNVWFSYDYGPITATSKKMGNEDEFLVSPHKVVYQDFKSDSTRQIAVRNHHRLTPDSIAFKSFRDKLTDEGISDAIDNENPNLIIRHLLKTNNSRLKSHHIDKIVQKYPELAVEHLEHKLQPHHIDHIVQKEHQYAAAYLKDKLQPHHIDHIVQKSPTYAGLYLADKLQPHHVDYIVPKAPGTAIIYLANQLTPEHIDQIVQKDSWAAARLLKDQLQPHHIDHIVQKDHYAAALHLKDHPYYQQKYLNKSEAAYFEPLQKGRKDGLKMYGENPTPEQKEHVKWAYDKMPNENWATWTIRHHREKPQDFTPEVKSQLEHFAGSQHFKEIADVRFDKQHDLHTGLGMLRDAENTALSKITKRYAPKPADATKVLDVGDGWSWWDLNKSQCTEEGGLMGHCGNTGNPQEGDTILSLRKEHIINGKKYYEPFATFIKNGDAIGEMKGRANKKPAEKYHKAIAELFKHTKLHPFGGGYKPHENFSPNDFSPELYNEVKQAHPDIAAFRNDDEEGKMTLSDEFVNRVIKEDPHRAAFTFGPRLNPKQIQRLKSQIPWLKAYDNFNFDAHLQPHQVDIAVDESPVDAARLLSHKLTPEQIDSIVERHPDSAAEYLAHLLQPHHVDHIVHEAPEHAMILLPKLLQQHNIDKLVRRDPERAAQALAKHPLLQPHHIDHIAQEEPWSAARYLADKLQPHHVDRMVRYHRELAAEFLKDKLTPEHIDYIVQKEPYAAAKHLADKLQPHHIDHIVQKDSYIAAKYLGDKLQPHHIDHIVQKDSYIAAKYLGDKLQPHHIDHIVQKAPSAAAEHLKDKLTPEHIDHIVRNAPRAAAEHLKDKLTPEHIDQIVQKEPAAATYYLNDQLQPHHIDHIVQKEPAAAAEYLKDHPYYQQKYLNKSEQLKSNSSLNLIGEKFDISALIHQDYSDF